MKLGISEILKKADEAKTKAEKKDILQKNSTNQLVALLQYCFDPRVKFLLPEEINYKPNDMTDCENALYTNARLCYLFIDGGHSSLTQKRREQLFVNFLEGLAPADAELMISIKNKKLPYKTITEDLVRQTFLGILPEKEKHN